SQEAAGDNAERGLGDEERGRKGKGEATRGDKPAVRGFVASERSGRRGLFLERACECRAGDHREGRAVSEQREARRSVTHESDTAAMPWRDANLAHRVEVKITGGRNLIRKIRDPAPVA